jgi:hypothetical protein
VRSENLANPANALIDELISDPAVGQPDLCGSGIPG